MRTALIIGGSSFMGRQLVWRLLASGWHVTILNRGQHADTFGNHVQRIVVDRRTPQFETALKSHPPFDAVIDFAAYGKSDTRGAVAALKGHVGHYLFISSGAAYLAKQGAELPVPRSLAEDDYPGPLATPPKDATDLVSWRYGARKREAEAELQSAWLRYQFPCTVLRLPIVNGLADPEQRLEGYLWRLRDQAPVILPDGGQQMTRHVYATEVVNAIAQILGMHLTWGKAYNLSQDEEISLSDLVRMLAVRMGAPDRQLPIASPILRTAGLDPRMISPFSGKWTSRLDASLAKATWGFTHRSLGQYLDAMVDAFFADGMTTPPENYRQRAKEIEFARHF